MKHLARWGACVALLLAGCATPAPAGKEPTSTVKVTPAPAAATPAQPHPKAHEHPPAQPAAQAIPGATPAAKPVPAAPTKPWLVAKEATRDLGTIDRGAPAKHTFIVKNTGDKELKILAKPG